MRIKNLPISFLIATFLGLNPWSSNAAQQSKEPIKIGLLIPDNKSLAARQGAELAIRNANQKAGPDGKHFSLVVKSLEGPWGTGSKQAVSLIFDDKVSAIIGSCDGRNAHLIEQVCTKSRVVFLSAWSGDPSLSKAFVPWFFNCVPNYNQQADAFINEIYNKRKLTKIAVISDKTYDSELARDSFVKKSLLAGKNEPLKLSFSETDDLKSITDQIKSSGVEGLVITGNVKSSASLIAKLKTLKISLPVFGFLALPDEEKFSIKDFENVIFISPGSLYFQGTGSFRSDYQKEYGIQPGVVAALSYDGMNLLIHAMNSGGIDRESIQKALLKFKFEGITGPINFDEKGNRSVSLSMFQIKNGIPVSVEKN